MLNNNMPRTKEYFYSKIYRKNNSQKSVNHAKTSLVIFERYYKTILENESSKVIEELKTQAKEDPHNVYDFLDNYVDYLTTVKKKNDKLIAPATVVNYFQDTKRYLRFVGILISQEMVNAHVTLPKGLKDIPKPIEYHELVTLVSNANTVTRKALYLTLISSGMRIGETLALKKSDFDMSKDPARIHIPARVAKNRHSRITFISREAKTLLSTILLNLEDDELVFTKSKDNERAELTEATAFDRLRKKVKLDDFDVGEKRHRITMHKLRKFCTTALVTNGMAPEYKNAITGWKTFDETYHEFDVETLAQEYLKVELNLLVMPEWRQKYEIKEKDKEIAKIKEQAKEISSLSNHVDKVEERLSQSVRELRENKVEKFWQKLELDVRKSNPRLANKIIDDDWERDVNDEKLKGILSFMSMFLENDGGLEGMLQGKDYDKFLKKIPKIN